ncbi:hypothetical protein LCGC14_1702620 [marine sediment metagenome]|uniref:Uncharacterized protein n=1 Tax=marine sediment metagenome TaxID=412755 RepID=A0A0F9JXZ7_9ZZZZ
MSKTSDLGYQEASKTFQGVGNTFEEAHRDVREALSTEKPLQLSEACPTCHKLWVSGSLLPEPNRFDPYEALDAILRLSTPLREDDFGTLVHRVDALRAYITGMEQ